MESGASISISLADGKLEIVGSEQFVKEQYEACRPLLERTLSTGASKTPEFSAKNDACDDKPDPAPSENKYSNVLHYEGDVIRILKTPPGTTADKMARLSMLYLLAARLHGIPSAPFDTLRDVCASHGCLDGSNFASTIKREKTNFAVVGRGRRQNASLTIPGMRAAEELAAALNG